MATPTKYAPHCDGCREKGPARYRPLLDLFLCPYCEAIWRATGKVPEPEVNMTERTW